LKAAVQVAPAAVGIDLANWTWKGVRVFVQQVCGRRLSRSSCLNYLHRLGFVLKRPKKRLSKADEAARAAFVRTYHDLQSEARRTGAKIFFVDEAHFRADVDLRAKWVLRGEPALVDSTSPRLGEKASYYSGVCLETGDVEFMDVPETSTAETSTLFLTQLRTNHPEHLIVIWDNGPAHRGEAIRTYLKTANLNLRLVALPAYSPDFNADEAIWDWVREEVTANTCFGTKVKVQDKVGGFFVGLAQRKTEVQQRCRTTLQAQADKLSVAGGQPTPSVHVDFTLVSV
jgi:transposase